jgi:hypothetical protein
MLKFGEIHRSIPNRRQKSVGDAFDYAVAFRTDWSVWLIVLYNHFAWLAIVNDPE